MASPHALDESKLPEQNTQVVEAQIRIRATGENPLEKQPASAHAVAPSGPGFIAAPTTMESYQTPPVTASNDPDPIATPA